jgi:hypothetical protein
MAKPKHTGLNVGAKHYRMMYKTESVTAAERALGGESMEKTIAERGISRLQVYLWAGLRGQTKGKAGAITMAEVQEVMDTARGEGMSYGDLWETVTNALVDSGWLRPPDVDDQDAGDDGDEEARGPAAVPSLVLARGRSDEDQPG